MLRNGSMAKRSCPGKVWSRSAVDVDVIEWHAHLAQPVHRACAVRRSECRSEACREDVRKSGAMTAATRPLGQRPGGVLPAEPSRIVAAIMMAGGVRITNTCSAPLVCFERALPSPRIVIVWAVRGMRSRCRHLEPAGRALRIRNGSKSVSCFSQDGWGRGVGPPFSCVVA